MRFSEKTVESLCTRVVSGGTPSTTNPSYYGGDIPWLRTQEVTFGYVHDTEIKITEAGLDNSAATWIPENSVIVAMYGNSAGRVAVNKIPLTTNQACCNLVVDPGKADYRFLYYTLLKDYSVLKGLSKGAAQNNLNAGQVRAYRVSIPPLPTQVRVGEILSAYDDLIENNTRRIALLEQAARLLFEEWFVRLRFPGREHTRIVDGVPEGWAQKPLGDILFLQRGFDLPTRMREFGTVPVYASTGIVGVHSVAKVDGLGVVTGRSGSLGVVTYVSENFWPLNTTLWVREFRMVSPIFAVYLLRQLDLAQYNGGAAVPTLDRKTVHRIPVLLPENRLLRLFQDFATPIFQQVRVLDQQNRAARTARDLLLPRLMTGEVAA